MMRLRVRGSTLSVTPSHRMLVPGREGSGMREVLAATLKERDHILCAASNSGVVRTEQLEAVDRVSCEASDFEVLAITFKPDLPVATFAEPDAVLTKGCAHGRRGRAPKWRSQGGQPDNDVASWPDTASGIGFLGDEHSRIGQ